MERSRFRAVLQTHDERAADGGVLGADVGDVALGLEDRGDPSLILECGIATSSWCAALALRRRVNMSAIGSVMLI